MDPDLLNHCGCVLLRSIQFQDVTELSELLHPDCVLHLHYHANGIMTRPGKRLSIINHNKSNTAATSTGGGHHRSSLMKDNNHSASQNSLHDVLPPQSVSQVVGMLNISNNYFTIFDWMRRGKFVAQPELRMDQRRSRKELLSLLQDGCNRGGPLTVTTHSSGAAACSGETSGGGLMNSQSRSVGSSSFRIDSLKEMHKHDSSTSLLFDESKFDCRLLMAKVSVLYGRPKCNVQEDVYVLEDGKIQLIDRFLNEPDDATNAQYLAEHASLFHVTKSAMEWDKRKHPVLDFSFCDLEEPLDLLRRKPISGKVHLHRTMDSSLLIPKEKEVFHPPTTRDQDGPMDRHRVVAKNRQGEKEAYEFLADRKKWVMLEEMGTTGDELDRLRHRKYDCDSLRLSSNCLVTLEAQDTKNDGVPTTVTFLAPSQLPEQKKITQVREKTDQLVKVLRNLVANYFLTIQWLDLSDNKLVFIPDVHVLPLTTFYLHANNISQWSEIEERVCTLPLLTSVTLFGNPLAISDKNYRNIALMYLHNGKKKLLNVKSLVGDVSKINSSREPIKNSPRNAKKTEKDNTKNEQKMKECGEIATNIAKIKSLDFVVVSGCDMNVSNMYEKFLSPRTPRGKS